jgi:hypothetical protein
MVASAAGSSSTIRMTGLIGMAPLFGHPRDGRCPQMMREKVTMSARHGAILLVRGAVVDS